MKQISGDYVLVKAENGEETTVSASWLRRLDNDDIALVDEVEWRDLWPSFLLTALGFAAFAALAGWIEGFDEPVGPLRILVGTVSGVVGIGLLIGAFSKKSLGSFVGGCFGVMYSAGLLLGSGAACIGCGG